MRGSSSRRRLARIVGALGALSLALHLEAAEWRLSRQLALDTTWSDNSALSTTAATASASEWQLRVTPGLVLRADGGRVDLNLAYSLNYLTYPAGERGDDLNHRLQANAKTELYRDRLFLDTTASIRQELIDPMGPMGGDDFANTANTQTVYTYSLTPSYRTPLGQYANLSLSLNHDGVLYADQGESSLRYGAQLDLHSGRSTALSWGLNARYNLITYEDDTESESASVRAMLDQTFTPSLSGTLASGYEILEDTGLNHRGGVIWESALIWTPNPRTRLRLGVGQRYFGWTPVLEWSHRRKRSIWTASYQRDQTTARDERLQNTAFVFEDEFGVARDPITGEPRPLSALDAAPSKETFVTDQFRTGYILNTGRSTFALNAAYRLRQGEQSAREESAMQFGFNFNRRLTPFMSATAGATWNYNEADNNTANNESYTLNLGLNRTLSRRLSTRLHYRFLEGNDYTENRVTLGMQFNWSK